MDMNHNEVTLTENAIPGMCFDIGIYAYSNTSAQTNFLYLDISAPDREAERLFYDIEVPLEAAILLEEDNPDRIFILRVLSQAVGILDLWEQGSQYADRADMWETDDSFHRSIEQACLLLRQNLYGNAKDVTVASVGHTHIDVAWKWPLRQTREKAVRSFNTVLHLMDKYPEYRFFASTPQLYDFVREEAPSLFEEIQKKVREGRWEAEGGMWLEADCNLISGESMVRQILYGKKYFREMFQVESEVLWLPDVFGYSAAMPQIMQKSGIHYFMTTKLAWNDTNRIPNDVMYWKGIDGSSVLAYFVTTSDYQKKGITSKELINYTYNGRQNASQVMGTWQAFQNKELTNEVLTCYGYGDGGGGPTSAMLEENRRMEAGIPGCPKTEQTSVAAFFERTEKKLQREKNAPVWNGELYLEYHRGTYTSMSENKAENRHCEFLNQEAETMQVIALLLMGNRYPGALLEQIWKLTLLNQFHDILPGSSIKEVYDESWEQYRDIREADEKLIYEAACSLAGEDPSNREEQKELLLFNTLGFARGGLVFADKETGDSLLQQGVIRPENVQYTEIQYENESGYIFRVNEVPAKGFRISDQETANEERAACGNLRKEQSDIFAAYQDAEGIRIQTPFYQVTIDMTGEMSDFYDKEAKRQLCRPGAAGLNHLQLFEDRPLDYDCWNIDATFAAKERSLPAPKVCRILETGALRISVIIEYLFLQSTIVQEIHFYRDDRRIDFETTLDWKEHQILLKAAFPLDILSDHVTSEIQFGNVARTLSRNTSWEQARFEECAHKWIDLSEADFGAAILNDGKFGYDADDQQLRLTLLKSGVYPNPDADNGFHHFVYSLYPHMGDYRKGRVIEAAYDLNVPIRLYYANCQKLREKAGQQYSLIRSDTEGVYADTVKLSEDGKALIIRLYEGYGARKQVCCDLRDIQPVSVRECDLMENELQDVQEKDLLGTNDRFSFEIRPFEIRTFRIGIKGEQ